MIRIILQIAFVAVFLLSPFRFLHASIHGLEEKEIDNNTNFSNSLCISSDFNTICESENFYNLDNTITNEKSFTFDFSSAINRALEANRSYLIAHETLLKSELNLTGQIAEFDFKMAPSGQLGVVGGGTAGFGATYGGGIDMYKKFAIGTKVSVYPYIYRAGKLFNSTLKLTITQPLLKGFGTEYNTAYIKGAEFAYRTSYRNLYIAKIKLIVRTITAIYEIIKQRELVRLNQESLSRLDKFKEAAKIKERIGLCDSLDSYRVENELKLAEESLQSAQERFEEANDALKDILALPMDSQVALDVPIKFHEIDFSEEEAVKVALSNRIELDQARDTIAENERLLRLARKCEWPELNMVVTYNNWGRDEYFTRSCVGERESTWGVGFTTSKDYDPLAQKTQAEITRLGLCSATINEEQAISNIVLEIKRLYRTLKHIKQRICLQEEQIKKSQGEFALANVKFERGFANNFDILLMERNLRQSCSTHFNAIIDHIIGEYQLLASMGLLADKPYFY